MLGAPEVEVWALSRVSGVDELREFINLRDVDAMFLASELVSAAASVEHARPLLTNLPLDVLPVLEKVTTTTSAVKQILL